MYSVFLGDISLPVAPAKLEIKVKNQNKTINLINDSEINIIRSPGLIEINFEVLLPNSKYSFARYDGDFKEASYFIEKINNLKISKKPFQFICVREVNLGKKLFDTNIKVSLEDYSIVEDANEGIDVILNVSLKQYKEYKIKKVEVLENNTNQDKLEVNLKEEDKIEIPNNRTHIVVKGDSMWAIAKKYYGDGSRYKEIYNANKEIIDTKNKDTGNPIYTIYPNQVFRIP